MRGIIAILSACLLSSTALLTTSVSAAELPVPCPLSTIGNIQVTPGGVGPAGSPVPVPCPITGAPSPAESQPTVEFDAGPLVAGLAAATIIAATVIVAQPTSSPVSQGANTINGRLR